MRGGKETWNLSVPYKRFGLASEFEVGRGGHDGQVGVGGRKEVKGQQLTS